MRAKIDINEVERRTKIRAKYLRAIENEEWDLLPGDVYVKSFLRTYGDFLGLDSRQLIDEYKRRYERPSDHDLRPISPRSRDRERERRPRGPLIPPWAVIGFVLLAVVVVLYIVGSHKSPPAPTPTHSQVKHHRAPSRTASRHTTTTVKHTPRNVKLQLVPTGSVYVCLVNGRGKPLIPGQIFTAGQTIPTVTSHKLLLTLGNASVKMTVNGADVAVAPSSTPIGFLLTPTSHKPLAAAQQPTCA